MVRFQIPNDYVVVRVSQRYNVVPLDLIQFIRVNETNINFADLDVSSAMLVVFSGPDIGKYAIVRSRDLAITGTYLTEEELSYLRSKAIPLDDLLHLKRMMYI